MIKPMTENHPVFRNEISARINDHFFGADTELNYVDRKWILTVQVPDGKPRFFQAVVVMPDSFTDDPEIDFLELS